ncbi:hypothetical protein GCM10025853_04480 [Tetragenococcus halophilus subsp. halophilus DSM 20339]|nr:hypothetical protein GCM10025853_04480 [Tetragenococcus halophilus subsp. halophilus DSM 20339]
MKVKLELDQALDKEMIILKTKTQSSEIKEIVAYIEQKSTPLVGKKQDKNYRIAINDFVNFYSSQKKFSVTQKIKNILFPIVYMN